MQKFCALCLTILLFAGCSKNTSIETNNGNNNNGGSNTGNNNGGNTGGNTNTNYYIKFSLDGTARTFDVHPQALLTSAFGATILSFIANSNASSGLEGISLSINNTPSDNPIIAGTYTETDVLNFLTAGVYNPGSTTEVYGAGVSPNPTNPLKIVISSIDATTATGTFSGDFIYVNSTTQTVGPGKKVISNGQFYLPVIKQ